MTSISISDIFTILVVLVDDWYQEHGSKFLKSKPGAKPEFTDSEVIIYPVKQPRRVNHSSSS